MAEWKILAASFATLLIISTLLVGNFGIKDFFSDIGGKISDWLSGSPFGGVIEIPKSTTKHVMIDFYPSNFSIEPKTPLNITLNSVDFSGFDGTVEFDYVGSKVILKQANTGLKIESPISEVVVESVDITKISLVNTKFSITTEQSNITAQDNIEINGFAGTLLASKQGIELVGNVSNIKGNGWEIG